MFLVIKSAFTEIHTHFRPSILNLYFTLLLSLALRLSAFRTATHNECFEKQRLSISSQSKFAYNFRWNLFREFVPLSTWFSALIREHRSNIAIPFNDIATYTSCATLLSTFCKRNERNVKLMGILEFRLSKFDAPKSHCTSANRTLSFLARIV